MTLRCVGVYVSDIFNVLIQEIEVNGYFPFIFISDTSHVPSIRISFLPCYSDIITNFTIQDPRLFPVHPDVADKLERRLIFIVFRQITCHLNWTVNHYTQGQLMCQRGIHLIFFFVFIKLNVEYPRSIVNWSGQHSGECYDRNVLGWITTV